MARTFDGTDDNLQVNSPVVTTYPFTVACWFKAARNTNQEALFIITDADFSDQFRMQLRGDVAGDFLRAESRAGGSQKNSNSSTNFSTGVWQHACAVFESATARHVYLDGGNKGSNTESSTPDAGQLIRTGIGQQPTDTPLAPFSGEIAEMTVWNVALSDAEVSSLAKRIISLRVKPENIVAYWPIYGLGTEEPNFTRTTGMNLTVTGATAANHVPLSLPWGFDLAYQGNFTSISSVTLGTIFKTPIFGFNYL